MVSRNVSLARLLRNGVVIFFLGLSGIFIINSTSFAAHSNICDSPANPIVQENCKQGTTNWHITKELGDIEGFTSATSVNVGESIDFYINANTRFYDLIIYRSGYYNGDGGRLQKTIKALPGQAQPACQSDLKLG